MADLLTAHPNDTSASISAPRLSLLSNNASPYTLNANGKVPEDKSVFHRTDERISQHVKYGLAPRNINYHVNYAGYPPEATRSRSRLHRFVFRKNGKEKNTSNRKKWANETRDRDVLLAVDASYDGQEHYDRDSFKFTDWVFGETDTDIVDDIQVYAKNVRKEVPLRRSASMNAPRCRQNILSLKRSSSFRIDSQGNSEESSGACSDWDTGSDFTANTVGYNPVLTSNSSLLNITKINKPLLQKLREEIPLREMKRAASISTLCSNTNIDNSSCLSTDSGFYTASTHVFEKRQLNDDTSLGNTVKLASKTNVKKKKGRSLFGGKSKKKGSDSESESKTDAEHGVAKNGGLTADGGKHADESKDVLSATLKNEKLGNNVKNVKSNSCKVDRTPNSATLGAGGCTVQRTDVPLHGAMHMSKSGANSADSTENKTGKSATIAKKGASHDSGKKTRIPVKNIASSSTSSQTPKSTMTDKHLPIAVSPGKMLHNGTENRAVVGKRNENQFLRGGSLREKQKKDQETKSLQRMNSLPLKKMNGSKKKHKKELKKLACLEESSKTQDGKEITQGKLNTKNNDKAGLKHCDTLKEKDKNGKKSNKSKDVLHGTEKTAVSKKETTNSGKVPDVPNQQNGTKKEQNIKHKQRSSENMHVKSLGDSSQNCNVKQVKRSLVKVPALPTTTTTGEVEINSDQNQLRKTTPSKLPKPRGVLTPPRKDIYKAASVSGTNSSHKDKISVKYPGSHVTVPGNFATASVSLHDEGVDGKKTRQRKVANKVARPRAQMSSLKGVSNTYRNTSPSVKGDPACPPDMQSADQEMNLHVLNSEVLNRSACKGSNKSPEDSMKKGVVASTDLTKVQKNSVKQSDCCNRYPPISHSRDIAKSVHPQGHVFSNKRVQHHSSVKSAQLGGSPGTLTIGNTSAPVRKDSEHSDSNLADVNEQTKCSDNVLTNTDIDCQDNEPLYILKHAQSISLNDLLDESNMESDTDSTLDCNSEVQGVATNIYSSPGEMSQITRTMAASDINADYIKDGVHGSQETEYHKINQPLVSLKPTNNFSDTGVSKHVVNINKNAVGGDEHGSDQCTIRPEIMNSVLDSCTSSDQEGTQRQTCSKIQSVSTTVKKSQYLHVQHELPLSGRSEVFDRLQGNSGSPVCDTAETVDKVCEGNTTELLDSQNTAEIDENENQVGPSRLILHPSLVQQERVQKKYVMIKDKLLNEENSSIRSSRLPQYVNKNNFHKSIPTKPKISPCPTLQSKKSPDSSKVQRNRLVNEAYKQGGTAKSVDSCSQSSPPLIAECPTTPVAIHVVDESKNMAENETFNARHGLTEVSSTGRSCMTVTPSSISPIIDQESAERLSCQMQELPRERNEQLVLRKQLGKPSGVYNPYTPGRSFSSPALTSTPEVRVSSHRSASTLQGKQQLKRSQAMSCLHTDRFPSKPALNDTEDSVTGDLSGDISVKGGDVCGERNSSSDSVGDDKEGKDSSAGHTVRFASVPIVRIYSGGEEQWTDNNNITRGNEDDEAWYSALMNMNDTVEERQQGCIQPSPGRKSETIDRIHGKTKQEEIPNESEYNHHQYVAHAQDGADSLISKKTPYVPPHSGEQNGKHDRKGEELHGTIEMLNIDKGYCAMEGNNKATYKTYSGVTKSGDKRTRSDVERIGEQDTDRSAAIVHGAMCIESPRSNEAKVIANEIETQRLPGQHTSHSACTWTSLTHQGQELNIGNREPSHEEVPTVDQPSGLDSDDKSPTQLKALEQSGDLSDIRTIVSNTGKSIQKPDLSRVNGWHITGITEPYHQSDWHFRDGECAKQSRLGASSSCTQQDLDVSPLTKERVTVNAWSTPAGNNAEPPPKSEESLSARIRKKSMLLAYDEGQLEIADDTTYRSLDIETDIDLITQINKVHEEFVHNMMTPLKSPENSSLKRTGSISKGSEFSSATSSVTKSQERKHSPPSGGNFKRNSPKSSSFRRPSGVSIASIDFDGKEQKPTTPLEKWQKLKKHISDSILGSTKHKQGRKTTSDSSLPQDYSSVRRASAADVATIPKVYRKDSGADLLCARGEDNDRTPKLERRPSLRRQRKLAMSPVENERLFNQLQKERTNSWSGSDDSGIHNNQSRSSTDVSITEDDQTKESNAVPGEQDVVVRRRRPHAQRRPKSDIGDHRWEDYGAMGGPPAPPPRTVTRRPISDPVMRDEDELVIYRDKRSSQPRPKSAHLGDYSSLSRDRPISPTPPPRCRPGSLAVIKDYGGEDNTGSATTTPTTENAPITIEATEESTKVPAGSKLRRARRPRPVSDLGHIDLKEIDDYVQRRRYSGVLSPEDMSVIQQPPQPFTPNSTESNISRSFSTPSALHQLIDPNIRPGNLHDEDSSSGEDISTSGYETIHTGLAPQDYYYEDYSGTMTYVEALWDHVTMDEDELPFQAGDVIEVTDKLDKDWWWGRINMKEGWFPASFVRPRVNQGETVEDCVAKIKDGTLSLTSKNMRKISISFLSKDQVRAKVINEITSTEKIYVKHLRDVCEGYLKQCCKRPEMFSSELVGKIFGNIEAIYEFQSKFMKKLESCVNQELPHLSEIGNCFLDNRAGFEIYAEYCNNHPTATAALQEVLENRKYRHFFEACRLLQEMIEISLDGFLLTPVQKICKYPLQLAELLKYTKPEDKDYEPVKEALQEMKNVASLINERKRRMESLHKIARWQLTIEAWEGEDVLERSSILIHSGEVTKISKGLGRAKVRQLFLFDHQIVLCKRDLLNRNRFSFTGRIYIDQIKLEDMDDGKDNAWGISVKNAFQLHNQTDEKWHIISVKSKEEKDKWVKAFADERKLVRDDRKKDFVIHSSKKVEAKFSALKEQSQQAAKKPKNVSRKISHMPFPHQLQPLVDKPQKSVTLPQGISSVDAFVGENYKKRTWNLFGTIRKKK